MWMLRTGSHLYIRSHSIQFKLKRFRVFIMNLRLAIILLRTIGTCSFPEYCELKITLIIPVWIWIVLIMLFWFIFASIRNWKRILMLITFFICSLLFQHFFRLIGTIVFKRMIIFYKFYARLLDNTIRSCLKKYTCNYLMLFILFVS